MNLAEDKKAPLRSKDLRLKRDMVVQWLNKTTIVRVRLIFNLSCNFYMVTSINLRKTRKVLRALIFFSFCLKLVVD